MQSFPIPKISAVLEKKYAGKPAVFLGEKVVHVGMFKSEKGYKSLLKKLLKRYPKAKEDDFGFTFILGKKSYIL